MKKLMFPAFLAAACALALTGSIGSADATTLFAPLSGWQEPPAIATPASGQFTATVSADRTAVDYVLSYDGFETPVLFAHIHLGLRSINGGVTVFLCGGGTPPTPPCPQGGGTVTGTFTAENVQALPAQRHVAGDLDKVLEAIEAGAAYVNVHSMDLPGGEIRGQIEIVP